MRTLEAPTLSVQDVVDCFIDATDDEGMKNRFRAILNQLNTQQISYENHGTGRNWWQYNQTDAVGDFSNDEMKGLYTNHMSKEGSSGFWIYSKIKNSSPNNRCPFCGVGVVSSLDHYLPKWRYSDICITPINLVPSCNDCNKFKHTSFPNNVSTQFLHPYYDDYSEHRWIKAVVEIDDSPVVSYFVDSEGAVGPDEEIRLRNHFSRLRLGRLYGSNAGEQLTIDKRNLELNYEADGEEGVRAFLAEELVKYQRINENSWQTAYYQSLLDSDWFLNEGLFLIPE